jgi:4-amino-4-deoxy-L-arabinose transferase-like glycosyltransferase
LAGFYVVSSLYISANLRVMWKALSEIEDQTPPVYFLITRTFDQMFHHDDIGLRVPSAIALGAGLLVTFDTARRLTDGLYGLIAMSVLATPFVTYYGYEARAYAIYLMFAAIALWLWVFTKAESKTAATFGAVFLIGVAIHYYFVLCLLPFGIMALAQRRIFHPKVMAATAGVMVSLAVLYPQIAKSRAFAKSISPVWAPSIVRLLAAYQGLLPNVTLLLVFIAIGLVVFSKPRNHLATP